MDKLLALLQYYQPQFPTVVVLPSESYPLPTYYYGFFQFGPGCHSTAVIVALPPYSLPCHYLLWLHLMIRLQNCPQT